MNKYNKLCNNCAKECKQLAFVTVLRCPFNVSKKSAVAKAAVKTDTPKIS
jgi:hypothetical protein